MEKDMKRKNEVGNHTETGNTLRPIVVVGSS